MEQTGPSNPGADALREAATAARGMHDPVNSECEEWASWLEARADRTDPPVNPPPYGVTTAPLLSWTPPGAEERKVMVLGDPRKHTATYSATYRQIGWLDQSGQVWPLAGGAHISPAPFTALWIEVGTD